MISIVHIGSADKVIMGVASLTTVWWESWLSSVTNNISNCTGEERSLLSDITL